MDLVSIADCNGGLISVFFDSDVLLEAIRTPGTIRDHVTEIDPPLRLVSIITVHEVAFAHKGHAISTLQRNESWIRDHLIKEVSFNERVSKNVNSFRTRDASRVRGKTDLGDWLLTCFARYTDPTKQFAIATRNRSDFEQLPVRLVAEFV